MPRPRRLAALLAAAAVLGCGLLAAGLPSSATAAAPALVADRTTDLQDASAITLTGSGRTPRTAVDVLQCRAGDYEVGSVMIDPVQLLGHQVPRWYADCDPDVPNSKVDNAGRMQLGVADGTGHLTVASYVHEGTFSADRPDVQYAPVHVSFDCDAADPCTLVVMDADSYKVQQSLPITFAPTVGTACAAPTDSTPEGVGPYSMTPAYSRWAAASCATGTASPLLADYTDTGEAAGLTAFATGQSDFAFAAAGFTSAGGSDIPDTRPAVFTPLAAEAAVIAFDGNSVLQSDSGATGPVPITDLSLTMTEVAQLFSDPFGTSEQKSPQLVARNPQLRRISGPLGRTATLVVPDGVIATPDAGVLAMTTAWSALPKSPWTHGILRAFPNNLGSGADTSAIPLLSTLPALGTRVLGSIFVGNNQPAPKVFLYLTDSSTAARLGLHVAKLQNGDGQFVAPTPESIAAGVQAMKPGADGLLAPDPAAADPAAYPLPLVQYAVTPHTTFDAARKAQLLQFLTYVTTTGQRAQDLAPGVFPLTPDLGTAAKASLALIGSAADAAATTIPTGGSSSGPLGGAPVALPHLPVALPHLPVAPAPAAPAPVAPGGGAPAASPTPAPVAIPAFRAASESRLGGLRGVVGVIGLALLLCAASYATSGRAVPIAVPAGLHRRVSRGRQLLRRRGRS